MRRFEKKEHHLNMIAQTNRNSASQDVCVAFHPTHEHQKKKKKHAPVHRRRYVTETFSFHYPVRTSFVEMGHSSCRDAFIPWSVMLPQATAPCKNPQIHATKNYRGVESKAAVPPAGGGRAAGKLSKGEPRERRQTAATTAVSRERTMGCH